MQYNIEKIDKLTGFVDKFIQMAEVENSLDENQIEIFINQAISITGATYTQEEIEIAKKDITCRYQIKADPGTSILADYEQTNWYDERKNEIKSNSRFWNRYKNYLIDVNKFSPNVVSTLGDDTLDRKLMNYIVDPKAEVNEPILKRGLIIGDVQSGKTSTYIGFLCKAADAGYKVFILLTGTIESLRKQTQERVEEGFVGIDMSYESGGKRVGVGLDNKTIYAMTMTSRVNDFTGNNNKIALSLSQNKDAVVFVIKKNITTLTKLTNWLITLNADQRTQKIDMPMLMIDDEADNASINTGKSKEDPTTINRLIRRLASVFTKSNYVGFTATPFANVFIDPETTENMENQDLFPEDFIVALPTPSNYVGANRIFSEKGEFYSQLNFITDAGVEQEDGYSFYFKHKKEWEDDLPNSLIDSIYTFYLANALRDLRGQNNSHRSMLINISRFIKVQKYTKLKIEEIHSKAYSAIKYSLSSNLQKSLKDPIIDRIYRNWQKEYAGLEFTWDEVVKVLFSSIENIQIKIVNSSKGSEKLDYPKDESLRVIAIGGLALSRGLTLEGLCVSYFYRNTSTYDVLMQMGRWFGYRKGYEDIFRIWTHKDSAKWYAEIADATDKLKEDMSIMREQGRKPRDFGIRIRNDSQELRITANNKMRNAKPESEIISYFGGIIETPYLNLNSAAHIHNFTTVKNTIDKLISDGKELKRKGNILGKDRLILCDVDKETVVNLISKLKISQYSSNFNTTQICDFLLSCNDKSIDLFDIAFIEGDKTTDKSLVSIISGESISKVIRKTCVIESSADRLSIGKRGKLGGPADGIVGIIDFNGNKAEDILNQAKLQYRMVYQEEKGIPFNEKNKTYPSDTWFKYVNNRKPILLVYLIDVDVDDTESNQKIQIDKLKKELNGTPVVGFALGLPKNDQQSKFAKCQYKVNKIYNWFEREEIVAESGEEE